MKKIAGIDIGSTYTKGALFYLEGNELRPLSFASAPTDSERLSASFGQVLESLKKNADGDVDVFYSSSAKGGLRVAAIGIVPDLTLNVAKMAALSAGARIENVFAYKLTDRDIDDLKKGTPDIVLFTGGTDGGAETYVAHNAEMLAAACLPCPIIFAGNRFMEKKVAEILKGSELYIVDNVLPELDTPKPDSAREEIRKIFLKRIVSGKGLDEIASEVGSLPNPTPYSMFELAEAIHSLRPDFGDFCVVDMGGATTDFYSCGGSCRVSSDMIYKGLEEPVIKRTVEGDLGMRVSARAAFESMEQFIAKRVNDIDLFKPFIEKIDGKHDFLPETDSEKTFDNILAQACCFGSALRHAGTKEEAFTANGRVWIQRGKDISGIDKIIGTGGYLSRMTDFYLPSFIETPSGDSGKIPLLPCDPSYFVDSGYLWPLLGNLVFKYPRQAADLALKSLHEINIG